MGRLHEKVAVVVGVGPGIGRACAAALREAGAKVVVAARDGARLAALAAELGHGEPGSVVAIEVDAGEVSSCRGLIDQVTAELGGSTFWSTLRHTAGGTPRLTMPTGSCGGEHSR